VGGGGQEGYIYASGIYVHIYNVFFIICLFFFSIYVFVKGQIVPGWPLVLLAFRPSAGIKILHEDDNKKYT
jgi:hypothetical protein